MQATSQHRRAFAHVALAGQGVCLKGRPVIVPGTGPIGTHQGSGRPGIGLGQEVSPTSRVAVSGDVPGEGPTHERVRVTVTHPVLGLQVTDDLHVLL